MQKQITDMQETIRNIAEEQVLFLRNRYRMNAKDIICLYTGERVDKATYTDAIRSIMLFNSQNAKMRGFIAS
jgi:hypothetical protein